MYKFDLSSIICETKINVSIQLTRVKLLKVLLAIKIIEFIRNFIEKLEVLNLQKRIGAVYTKLYIIKFLTVCSLL